MAKSTINNVKLGVFVLAGLLFLVLLLYMIGKNNNLFGSTYVLKARFENVQGLVAGNNVRYLGIECGTVKSIKILADTVIEVTMAMDDKMRDIIRKNAITSIGTEGIVGNKVVNISAAPQQASLAAPGDVLVSRKMLNTDAMLQTLTQTNSDMAAIAGNLKITVSRFNNSSALWSLLNDESIPAGVKASISNVRSATSRAGLLVDRLDEILADVKNGKGSLGAVLTDTSFSSELRTAIIKMRSVSERADSLAIALNNMTAGVQHDIDNGKGTVHALLKDSTIVSKLQLSLDNIQKGTESFNESMEALKHNFLLRGYFKKQERRKKAAAGAE